MAVISVVLASPSPQVSLLQYDTRLSDYYSAAGENITNILPAVSTTTESGYVSITVSGVIACPVVPTYGLYDDIYGQVYIQPSVLNVGVVYSAQNYTVYLWNASSVSKQTTAVSYINADGVFVNPSGPVEVFAPYQEREFTVTVTTNTLPTIDADIVFDFGVNGTATFNVIGVGDITLFGFNPNWEQGILERLEWKTDVLPSFNNKEQRVQLRKIPKRSFEYSFIVYDYAPISRFLNMLWKKQSSVLAVPLWIDQQRLTADVAAGATSIPVTTTNYRYAAGEGVVLWQSYNTYEMAEIFTVSPTSVGLTKPLQGSWAKHITKVIPLVEARVKDTQSITKHTYTLLETTVDVSLTTDIVGTSADTGDTYQTFKVLADRTDENDVPTMTWEHSVNTVDFGILSEFVDKKADFSSNVQTFVVVVSGRTSIEKFRQWLNFRAGKKVPFWKPTWRQDFIQTQQILSNSVGLVVENVDYYRYINSYQTLRDIVLLHKNGTKYYRRVVSAAYMSDAEELLTLDSSLGVTVNVGDLKSISFMELVRLDSDTVELFWETDTLVRCELNLRTVYQ